MEKKISQNGFHQNGASAARYPHDNGSSSSSRALSHESRIAAQNKSTPHGTFKQATVTRRIPGGIQINTIKRPVAPPRSCPIPSTSTGAAHRINGLSEEKRQRVEEIRRDRERKKKEEEELLRPVKKKVVSSTTKTIKRRKTVAASDDENTDDLFSAGESKSKKKRRPLQPTQSNQGYQILGRSDVLPYYSVARELIDESAFQKNVGKDNIEAVQSSSLVLGKSYGPFFSNITEEQSKVLLEYPAVGVTEEFSLLVPKDRDEYDPISDLLRTVRCIVEFYLTSGQQEKFGSLDALEIGSAAGQIFLNGDSKATTPLPISSREASVLPSEKSSHDNVLHPHLASGLGDRVNESLLAAPLDLSIDSPNEPSSTALSPAPSAQFGSIITTASSCPIQADSSGRRSVFLADSESILRSFTKARNRRDGQLFIRTVDRFNIALRELKDSGEIEKNVKMMGEKGVNEGIWRCIQEQSYARTVAPRVEELAKYEAFSDNVYGELLPRFMSEIAQLTNLKEDSCFVDLGSGVGNLLIQIALQTGSKAYGCEMMKVPSELASKQIAEAKKRWKMWGLQGGECQAWQGDFGEDIKIGTALKRADVVLVNNYAFTAPTNDKLSLQFLDLKDGAKVVSLKPFVPPDFRLTERTLSSPLAILRVAQRTYTSGCVSWADGGGKYYIHTVDRTMIAEFLEGRNPHSVYGKMNGDVRKEQWKAARETSEGE